MMVSLSADHELDGFDWYVFNGEKKITLKGYNQKHDFVVEKGDIFGLRSTRQLGKYQAVHSRMTHVLFRNVEESKIDTIIDKSKAYRGKPIQHPELADGRKRAMKTAIKPIEITLANRLSDQYFSPKNVIERSSYDRQDYQWRSVGKQIRVKTLKMGKARKPLEVNDLIGLRYVTAAKGGYIIMPNHERVNISTETYKDIIENSRIVPRGEQRQGVVNISDIKADVLNDRPEGRRATLHNSKGGGGAATVKRRLAGDPVFSDDEDDFEDSTDESASLMREMLSPGSMITITRARTRKVMVYRMKVDEKKNHLTLWFLGIGADGKPDIEDVYYSKMDSRLKVSDMKAKIKVDGHYPTTKLKRILGVELADAKIIQIQR